MLLVSAEEGPVAAAVRRRSGGEIPFRQRWQWWFSLSRQQHLSVVDAIVVISRAVSFAAAAAL